MAKRRKRGDGGVSLRKDGRWEGRCVVGYDDKGLPITKNVLAKTKTECTEKLKKLRESCNGQLSGKLHSDMLFGEWLDFWYQNYSKPKLRPTTQMGYENAIYKHIIPALGKIPLSELSTNEIQQFYAKLKKEGRLIRTELYGEGVSDRTIVLPPSLVEVLKEYRQGVASRWMFPSPVKEDSPLDPATCRKRLQTILDHAGCKRVRFHDLRHVFVTTALESGMDVKTLSTIIGHVSAKTTLNIYTHVTDAMRQTAAAKIDRGIRKCEPRNAASSNGEGLPTQTPDTRPKAAFEPYKGKIRKAGTGCIMQINDHLWEGRYSPRWPDGKIHSRNVYAATSEECEAKLVKLILQMKAEIAEAKQLAAAGRWEEAMALAGQKKARGTKNIN